MHLFRIDYNNFMDALESIERRGELGVSLDRIGFHSRSGNACSLSYPQAKIRHLRVQLFFGP